MSDSLSVREALVTGKNGKGEGKGEAPVLRIKVKGEIEYQEKNIMNFRAHGQKNYIRLVSKKRRIKKERSIDLNPKQNNALGVSVDSGTHREPGAEQLKQKSRR